MKKLGIIIFGAALITGVVVTNIFSLETPHHGLFNFSVNFGTEKGNGRVATQQRSATDFRGVDVGGVFQVEITAGRDFEVEVEADENLLPLITTKVDGGILKIEAEKKITSDNPLRVRISAPDINELDVSGAANLKLSGVKNNALSVDSNGASKVKVSGETNKLALNMSGASKVDADELRAANVNVDASGASRAKVNVSEGLSVDASGASHITYSGTPATLHKKTTGASGVSQARSDG